MFIAQLLVVLLLLVGTQSLSLIQRAKRHAVSKTRVNLVPTNELLSASTSLPGASFLVSQPDFGEGYQSGGVPLWVPVISFLFVGLSVFVPKITRRMQTEKNTRRAQSPLDEEKNLSIRGRDEKL
jgi:hypothetical protein